MAEYQQKAREQQFVIASNTEKAINQLFEDYDLIDMLSLSKLTRITPSNRKITSGTASLQKMILFEIVEFNHINADTEMDYASLTFIVLKTDADYISKQLKKLLHNQPVMVLKRELSSINYDIHESTSIFSVELLSTIGDRDINHRDLDSMALLLEIMSNKHVLNEIKATNINTLTSYMLPLFYQKLRHTNDRIAERKIRTVLQFIQKLSLAELL